jgi:hypothetical protein
MGFPKVLGKSVWKAFKSTGRVVGSAAAVAGLVVLSDPEALTPVWVAVGPWGPLAVIGVNFIAKAALDAYKHRNDSDPV